MLTAPFVASITVTRRTEYPDALVPGLVLRVTPTGAKSWCLRYRAATGQSRRHTLGRASNLTLAKARHKARQVLHAIAAGHDPADTKRRHAAARTVGALADDYMEKHAKVKKRPQSWRQDDWMLRREVLPYWAHRHASEITRRDVRERLEAIVARGAPVVANRVLAVIRKMYNFGIRRDWVDTNPAMLIEPPTVEVSRDRVLSDDELRTFWRLCDQEPPTLAAFMRLRLVTAQRGGELARLAWADVTDEAIIIPATVAKNGRAHRVPLSEMTRALLATLPRVNPWLFPGRSGRMALSVLNDASTRIKDRMTTLLRETDPTAVADFRGHDLRRTAATRMAEAGVPLADISRVLNHAEAGPRATQVYQRYEFDREKRVALETWARVLTGILAGTTAETVLPFTVRRG